MKQLQDKEKILSDKKTLAIGLARRLANHLTRRRDSVDLCRCYEKGTEPDVIAGDIERDGIDVVVDLAGHAGTEKIGMIIDAIKKDIPKVSYMGFPGIHGSSYITHQIVDTAVVPKHLRHRYGDCRMIYMPFSYFVNSHAGSVEVKVRIGVGVQAETRMGL